MARLSWDYPHHSKAYSHCVEKKIKRMLLILFLERLFWDVRHPSKASSPFKNRWHLSFCEEAIYQTSQDDGRESDEDAKVHIQSCSWRGYQILVLVIWFCIWIRENMLELYWMLALYYRVWTTQTETGITRGGLLKDEWMNMVKTIVMNVMIMMMRATPLRATKAALSSYLRTFKRRMVQYG